MGQAIAAAIADDPGFALDQDHGDVLIDFSAPAALQASLDRAQSAGVPILVGTTGLDALADQRIAAAAKQASATIPATPPRTAARTERAGRFVREAWYVSIPPTVASIPNTSPSTSAPEARAGIWVVSRTLTA
jgi:4-hydroxy-tetrahydrodipicolinate reductase